MQGCPANEILVRLLVGELSSSEEETLDEHLSRCATCRRSLEELTAPPTLHICSARPAAPGGPSPALIERLKKQPVPGRWESPLPERAGAETRSLPKVAGYEMLDLLGHGGMGVVYKARQIGLNRTVALKMILGGAFASQRSRDRFRAEAEAVARLQHPNIIQIHEIGEVDGLSYLCLEFVEGGTLAGKLVGAAFPPRHAAELAELLARAVHFGHERGILHRDLKPANILLTSEGAPKIADFGLAKRLEESPELPDTPSEPGMALGTPRYMAPENLQNTSRRRAVSGPAGDVYSLGAILYELLTGRPLYAGATTVDVLVRVLHEDPTPPRRFRPEIPRDLEVICLKCLNKNPHHRYVSALALAGDLQRFLLGDRVLARGPSRLYRSGKFIQRNTILVGASAGVGLALLVGVLAATSAAFRESNLRKISDSNTTRAENSERQALAEAYQARMAAALAALDDHNIPEAADQLEAAPKEQRGWEWDYVAGRLNDSLAEFHDRGYQVALGNPAENWIATTNQSLVLLDASTGQVLRKLTGEPLDRTIGLANSNNLWVLIEKEYRPSRLFELNKDFQVVIDIPDKTLADAAAVDEAGTRLAISYGRRSQPNQLNLLELKTGKLVTHMSYSGAMLTCVAFSPDGRRLASGGEDRIVRIWDTQTGACLHNLHGHTGVVHAVAFSPDGKRVLSGSADQTFRQWNAETGELLDERYGHVDKVHSVAYNPDGRTIASGSFDDTVRLWHTEGGPPITVLHGHTAGVLQVGFSRDGKRIASVSLDGDARIWDSGTRGDPRVLRGHTSYVYPVACSPDGKLIASGGWDNVIRLWDALTGEQRRVLSGHTGFLCGLVFSKDSRKLISLGSDNALRIWNVAAGTMVASLPLGSLRDPSTPYGIALHPDGTRVACPSSDRLHLVELDQNREAGSLTLPTRNTRLVAFSPDGKLLAVAGDAAEAYILDAASGATSCILKGHEQRLQALAFSPDGASVATAGADHIVRVWDARSGQVLKAFGRHTGEVFALAFHPGGKRLASGGRDRVIRIWDLASGAEVARLQGHTNYVFSLAFSPDGATLVSGSGDHTVRLWDAFPLSRRLQARERRAGNEPDSQNARLERGQK